MALAHTSKLEEIMNLLRLTLLTAGLMGLFGCDDSPPDSDAMCCVNGLVAECTTADDHVKCGGNLCVPKGDTCPQDDLDASDDAADDAQ
jgi:hypothetical protein